MFNYRIFSREDMCDGVLNSQSADYLLKIIHDIGYSFVSYISIRGKKDYDDYEKISNCLSDDISSFEDSILLREVSNYELGLYELLKGNSYVTDSSIIISPNGKTMMFGLNSGSFVRYTNLCDTYGNKIGLSEG